mmetsp:Transcript_17406/g.31368  ORF Transcript_17406/g.31368 Transcript_17406/m.31368 type:complete len:244 (+) Transcript_17406:545-1276(+)
MGKSQAILLLTEPWSILHGRFPRAYSAANLDELPLSKAGATRKLSKRLLLILLSCVGIELARLPCPLADEAAEFAGLGGWRQSGAVEGLARSPGPQGLLLTGLAPALLGRSDARRGRLGQGTASKPAILAAHSAASAPATDALGGGAGQACPWTTCPKFSTGRGGKPRPDRGSRSLDASGTTSAPHCRCDWPKMSFIALPLSCRLYNSLWRTHGRTPSTLPTFCDDALGSCLCDILLVLSFDW